MSRDLFGGLDKARDLLCTPLALEVLDDLAQGRSPHERPEESKVVATAIRCLELLGAARTSSRTSAADQPDVEITTPGRRMYDRLVEIDNWAAQDEAYNAPAA